MKVLIVSNLDSRQPYGQFLRPFHMGAGLTDAGAAVAYVGVDCSAVVDGTSWSTSSKSLRTIAKATRVAARRFLPDVVYGHEMRGAMAALIGAHRVPLVADFHSLPSVEWNGYAQGQPPVEAAKYRLAGLRSATAERLIVRRAQRVVAAGDEVADELARRYSPRVAPLIVGNGVADHLLQRPAVQESPYGPGKHAMTTIPAAQSVSNARGLSFLARVADVLTEMQAELTIHVLGSERGPGAAALRYEGFKADLLPWVTQADVCLLPYPADAALCGGARNKLLEYLACGRTLVTTREGLRGLREAAQWPGVTVTGDDPRAFAAAAVAAAADSAPMLDDKRAEIHERLRWGRLAGEVLEVLAETTAERA